MADPTPESSRIVRARQQRASRTTAILLVGFVILVFAITIAKLTINR